MDTQQCTINVNSPALNNNTVTKDLDHQLTLYHIGSHTNDIVLLELDEQGVASTLKALKIHALPGNEPYEESGAYHIRNIFRDPVI